MAHHHMYTVLFIPVFQPTLYHTLFSWSFGTQPLPLSSGNNNTQRIQYIPLTLYLDNPLPRRTNTRYPGGHTIRQPTIPTSSSPHTCDTTSTHAYDLVHSCFNYIPLIHHPTPGCFIMRVITHHHTHILLPIPVWNVTPRYSYCLWCRSITHTMSYLSIYNTFCYPHVPNHFLFFLMIPHYHTHTIVLLLGEIRYVTPPRQTHLFPMLVTTSSATAAVPQSHYSRVYFRCISLCLPVRINHGLRWPTPQQQQQKHITLFPDRT